MINALIVEDEFMVAKRLKRFVEAAFKEQTLKLHVLASLDDAFEYLAQRSIDVLFLDLNLQGKDGFELLKQTLCESFHTIVVSANSERAIEAFDIGVLDFVAKPFTQARIQKAVDRLQQQAQLGLTKYITYKHLGTIELMPVTDILYLKANGHYCEIVTMEGLKVLHDKNLDKLLALLPSDFVRIHRSYALPLSSIKSIAAEGGSKYTVIMKNAERLPIGRTKVAGLREQVKCGQKGTTPI
jgi:two-component system response regulator LytT